MAPLLAIVEPSKVPFYIVGGVLVLWAVGLAGLGLRSAEFPYSIRGERGVITISVLLILGTIAAAIFTSPSVP